MPSIQDICWYYTVEKSQKLGTNVLQELSSNMAKRFLQARLGYDSFRLGHIQTETCGRSRTLFLFRPWVKIYKL